MLLFIHHLASKSSSCELAPELADIYVFWKMHIEANY